VQQIAGQVKQRTKVYADWDSYRKLISGPWNHAFVAGESGNGKNAGRGA